MLFSFQPGGGRRKYFCVYWKGSKDGGSWSTEGCAHLGSNDSHTQCKCSHLSSFAVLVALVPKVQFMVPYSELDCVQEDSPVSGKIKKQLWDKVSSRITWEVIPGSISKGLGNEMGKRQKPIREARCQVPLWVTGVTSLWEIFGVRVEDRSQSHPNWTARKLGYLYTISLQSFVESYIIDSMDINLSKFWEIAEDRRA